MQEIDPRIMRVGIEIGGQLKTFEDLWMSASGAKYANALQNEAEVRVANLSRADREYILTETSPFNQNRQRKRIVVDAGRLSTGYTRIFAGDIISATVTQPPDIILSIKAKTNQYDKGNIVAHTQAAQVPLSRIAKRVAEDLALQLVFEALDKNIANYSFTGAALKQVEQLGKAGNVNAFVDDETLFVKNRGAELAGVTNILSEDSGMVGIPELTEHGVRVRYMLDPTSRIGGRLTVQSRLNPSANGEFVIYKLNFDISNRDTPWYYTAESQRKNYAAETTPKSEKPSKRR